MFLFIKKNNDEEKKQNLTIKNILLNVASLKLNPAQFSCDDECAICCDEFKPEQQIIRLPCNEKHYFHEACIGEWIGIKSVCPICKAEITEETINKFKDPNRRSSSISDRLLKDSEESFELN